MTRNRERTAPWHRDHTIETVWPYLVQLQNRVRSLVKTVATLPAGSGGAGSLAQPVRITQQINFRLDGAAPGQYVGYEQAGNILLGAALLYRARGGEILRSLILSQPASATASWQVEIKQGAYTRASTSSFSVPVLLSLPHASGSAELKPNQTLTSGQCLFALVVSVDEETPGPLDGTLEIERNATIY